MQALGTYIARRPRTAAAIAFGGVTAAITHFAWFPEARMHGAAPALTIAAGLAHAVAGAITGPRLVDKTRTRTPAQACLLGAGTSLLALVLLAPLIAGWVSSDNVRPEGVLAYLGLTLLVGLFSFLAAGWALLLASLVVGWGLYRLTVPRPGG